MTARHDRAFLHQADIDEADILGRVRNGDRHAYGLLYERHVAGARRVAQAILRRSSEVDDAVAEGFASAFAAIRRGRGPTDCFGPYIKSCVRHECFRLSRRQRGGDSTIDAEFTADDAPDEFERLDETDVVKHAFGALPARMQTVLWYTEVEGLSHAEVAGATGGSSQAVAQLAMRARRELTTKYLQAHLTAAGEPSDECRDVRQRLAEIVRGSASRRVSTKTAAHLAVCVDCASAQDSLVAVNARLRSTPIVALIAGIGAPILVKLGWKARLVGLLSVPAANLTAVSGVMVISAAVGPIVSPPPVPSALTDGPTIEIVGESAPAPVDDGASQGVVVPSGGTADHDAVAGSSEADADAAPDRSSTARPRVVSDYDPDAAVATPATSVAAPDPSTATGPPTTAVTGAPPSPVTTVVGLLPDDGIGIDTDDLPVDLPAEVQVSVGPELDTDVHIGVPDLLPGDVALPLPQTSIAVTVPALPPVTLPGGTNLLPPVDLGAGVNVSAGPTGASTSVNVAGAEIDAVIDLNQGIDIDLGLVPACLPIVGKQC